MIVLLFATLYLPGYKGVLGSPYSDPNCADGRTAIVHLFEWKWTDIRAECERFLGPKGFCGVQVSPPNENAVVTRDTLTYTWAHRPWWERYQPVSYRLETRSGNERDFRDMVSACNKVGVRIYVDAVINHMTARFAGVGTAGSAFDATNLSFPAVPYTRDDFNGKHTCNTSDGFVHDYEDLSQRRNCELGLVDLNQARAHVRDMIVGYMNTLIDIGVAGFRIDAASHIWPGDLAAMFARLHHLKRAVFGDGKRPFIVQEVIEYGNSTSLMREYLGTGRVTRFNYSVALADAFLRKTAPLESLRDIGATFPPSGDALVFVSNHDTQRWHGNEGAPITFFEPKELKMASIFMLAYSYGVPRIMSSFLFNRSISSWETENYAQGPPHGDDMAINDVIIKPDMTCGNGWVCEHRWPEIFKMARFANVVDGTPVQNWQTFGDFQLAFARGNKGFVAMVAEAGHFNRRIHTGLPAGRYCDVISGDYVSGSCSGKMIDVDVTGWAHITLNGNSEVPVTAIHTGAML